MTAPVVIDIPQPRNDQVIAPWGRDGPAGSTAQMATSPRKPARHDRPMCHSRGHSACAPLKVPAHALRSSLLDTDVDAASVLVGRRHVAGRTSRSPGSSGVRSDRRPPVAEPKQAAGGLISRPFHVSCCSPGDGTGIFRAPGGFARRRACVPVGVGAGVAGVRQAGRDGRRLSQPRAPLPAATRGLP